MIPFLRTLSKTRLKVFIIFLLVCFTAITPFGVFASEQTNLSDFEVTLSARQSYLVNSILCTYTKWRDIGEDGSIHYADYFTETYVNFACETYISVYGHKSFFLFNNNSLAYNAFSSYAFYDSSRNLIVSYPNRGLRYDNVISIPDNAYYMRFSTLGGSSVSVSTARSRYLLVVSNTPASEISQTELPTSLLFGDIEISTRANVVQTVSSVQSCSVTYLDMTFEGDISFIQQLSFEIIFEYDNGTEFLSLPLDNPYIIPYTLNNGTRRYLDSVLLTQSGSAYSFQIVSSASTSVDGLIVVAPFDGIFSSVLLWSFDNWVVNDETVIANIQTEQAVGNLEQGATDLETLAEGLTVPQPDIGEVMSQIDDNLSVIDNETVSEISSLFPEQSVYTTMIVLVLTFGLLSFVLFGKKGDNGG